MVVAAAAAAAIHLLQIQLQMRRGSDSQSLLVYRQADFSIEMLLLLFKVSYSKKDRETGRERGPTDCLEQ